jgi:hypothetical protein
MSHANTLPVLMLAPIHTARQFFAQPLFTLVRLNAYCILFTSCITNYAGANPSPEQISRSLNSQYDSIKSLCVKYTDVSTAKPGLNVSEGTTHVEWIRQGELELKQNQPTQTAKGVWLTTWHAFDGKTMSKVILDRKDPQRIATLRRSPGYVSAEWDGTVPPELLGWRISYSEDSLAEVVLKQDAVLHGVESVDGVDCVHFEHQYSSARSGHPFILNAWLDPPIDYLPRKIRIEPAPDLTRNREALAVGAVLEYRNLDWMTIPTDTVDGPFHFPRRSKRETHFQSAEITVTEVNLNQQVPVSRFQPQPQYGTLVVELRKAGDTSPKQWIHGGDSAVSDHRRELINKARQESVAAAQSLEKPSINARPKSAAWLPMIWVVTLFLSAITVGVYLWQHFR